MGNSIYELEVRIRQLEKENEKLKSDVISKNSDRFLIQVFESIQDGISVLSPDLTIIKANSWMERNYGNDDTIVGKKCYQVYQGRSSVCPWCPVRETIETGEMKSEVVPYPTEENHTGWVELFSFPVINEYGSLECVVEHVRDVTNKKEAEKSLADKEKKLRNIIEHSKEMFYSHTPNHVFTYLSPQVEDILGYHVEEAKVRWTELVTDNPVNELGYQRTVEAIKTGKRQPSYELELYHKNGSRVWVEVNEAPVVENGKTVEIVGAAADITERKHSEEEKILLEERVHRAKKFESLGLLAGGVAHDLNNILSGIVSYPELLLMDLPEDSKLRKPLETIHDSGLRAAEIVKDLLAVARVGGKKEILDINRIVESYCASPEYQKLKEDYPQVRINVNLDDNLFYINGSPANLTKAIMNLVGNAAEAQKGVGDVTIRTENEYVDYLMDGYEQVRPGEYVKLSVSDTGEGITNEDIQRIFEPFYTKKIMGRSGTGLGMTVVWNTVHDHDGYLDIKSKKDVGTTVDLYFPITREAMTEKDIRSQLGSYTGEGEKILVVDDDYTQRQISEKVLSRLGYAVESVGSGEEAIRFLQRESVDLLVLDMIMEPGINGRVTYERILDINPNQKAIIVSGFSETSDVKAVQERGAGEYIKKPYTVEEIGKAIKEELFR